MKKRLGLLFVALATCGFLFITPVLASGQRLVNGAGTLPGGDMAFSLDLGFDAPEPILYGLRFDVGLGDRLQMGVGGTFFGIVNSFGLFSMFNFYKKEGDSDFVSLYLNPWFLHVNESGDDSVLIFLQPGLAYEHRFGAERRTGLFLKVGTGHFLGASTGSDWIAGGLGAQTTVFLISPGLQHLFGNRFSLTIEPFLGIDPKTTEGQGRVGYGGKLGLTWAF